MMTKSTNEFRSESTIATLDIEANNRPTAYIKRPCVCFDGLSHRLDPHSANQPNRPLGQGQFRCTPFLGLDCWPAKIPDLCQIEAVHDNAVAYPPRIRHTSPHVVNGKTCPSHPLPSSLLSRLSKVGHREGR